MGKGAPVGKTYSELQAKVEKLTVALEHEHEQHVLDNETLNEQAEEAITLEREQNRAEVVALQWRLAIREAELEEAREQLTAALELEQEKHEVVHHSICANAEEALALAREQHRLDVEALEQQLHEMQQLLAGAGVHENGRAVAALPSNSPSGEQVAGADGSQTSRKQWRASFELLELECAQLREELDLAVAAKAATEPSSQQDGDTQTMDLQRQVEQQTARADASDQRCEQLSARAAHLEQECTNKTMDLQRQVEQQTARADASDQRCEQLSARVAHLEQECTNKTIDLQRQVEQQTARADASEQRCEQLSARAAHLEQECANTAMDLQRQVEQQTARADALDQRCEQLSARAAHLEQECTNKTMDLQRQVEQQTARADASDQRCEQLSARAAHLEQECAITAIDFQRQVEQQTARAKELEDCCEQLRSRATDLEQERAKLQAALTEALKPTKADKKDVSSFARADMACHQSLGKAEKAASAGLPLAQLHRALEANNMSEIHGRFQDKSGNATESGENEEKVVWNEYQDQTQLAADILDRADREWAQIVDEIQSSVDNLSMKLAKLASEPENTNAESLRRVSEDFRLEIASETQTWSERIYEVLRRHAALRKELDDPDGASLIGGASKETSELQRLRTELKAAEGAMSSLKATTDRELAEWQEEVDRLCQELRAERQANSGGRPWFFCGR
eukprot:TRINITY_DN7011_c0_g1_i4.p1 TRINITY_DN7011_c0_g1~~TRINITY_DN7011_c0_g1_i4.p1  ORF type:complete len:691 (+),score=136.99 TRINITY_DN7011_c0_g1_i4:119-2191(+)